MSEKIETLIGLLLQHGYQIAIPLMLLTLLRPWAMLYTFIGFQWALGRSAGIRSIMAIVIGFPMVLVHGSTLEVIVLQPSVLPFFGIVLAELAVGACIGILASLPFWSLQYAGAISDQMRGETDSGIQSPAGGSITTFGNLYLVIGFLAFVTLNGFSWLFGTLLRSYQIWPTGRNMPELSTSSLWYVITLFGESISYAVTIAVPALVVLLAIELVSGICARLAPRFGFYNLAFLIKNLCAILILPFLVMLVWKSAGIQIFNNFQDIDALKFLIDE